MDFDPRDYDSRDEERFVDARVRGGVDDHDRDQESAQLSRGSRDRGDDGREPGRGPRASGWEAAGAAEGAAVAITVALLRSC